MQATSSNLQLLDLWRVDRPGEGQAFEAHAHLGNRRLLWHGTHVATVAAILKAGLRIMPHAGGRVGRGLYLVSAGWVKLPASWQQWELHAPCAQCASHHPEAGLHVMPPVSGRVGTACMWQGLAEYLSRGRVHDA